MMTSSNNSLPRVALWVLVLSLVLLPCAGRVGSKKQQFQKDKLRPVSRKLQGNYKGRHNNRGDRPKRNNHYGYYYIKREVDPCEYYGNCDTKSSDSEDVVDPRTDSPVEDLPTEAPELVVVDDRIFEELKNRSETKRACRASGRPSG